MEARWANASGVERIPFVPARARPEVILARRPAAERAPDARGFGLAGLLLFFKLVVWNNDRIVGEWTHDYYYDLRADLKTGQGNSQIMLFDFPFSCCLFVSSR